MWLSSLMYNTDPKLQGVWLSSLMYNTDPKLQDIAYEILSGCDVKVAVSATRQSHQNFATVQELPKALNCMVLNLFGNEGLLEAMGCAQILSRSVPKESKELVSGPVKVSHCRNAFRRNAELTEPEVAGWSR